MTTALGIAAVTATLRSLLSEGLVEHNLSGVLGSTATVSVLPPDRVVPQNGTEASQLNLFLHRVSANTGWRNEGLPSRDASGRNRLSNAPLALDLHYLLSAYSGGDLHAEILLGYAMQWLHESPLLTRGMIRQALTPAPLPGTPLERALFDSGLADQVELIKITPEHLDTEEMSKLWTATQSHLRPTAAYRATVVLIEASEPVRSALPVLTRGGVDPSSGRERGVSVEPGLEPAIPTLEALTPPGGQIVARLGETIDLTGHHLDGTGRTVLLGNDRFESELSLPALAAGGAALVQFSIPLADAATELPEAVEDALAHHRLGVGLAEATRSAGDDGGAADEPVHGDLPRLVVSLHARSVDRSITRVVGHALGTVHSCVCARAPARSPAPRSVSVPSVGYITLAGDSACPRPQMWPSSCR